MTFEIGSSTRRVEDLRLTRGLGRYVDDIRISDETHMVVVRSPHAAARIVGIDTAAAAGLPGVLAVLTGADFAADGLGHLDTCILRNRRDGSPMAHPPYPVLCTDSVHYAGDPVAIVVAETLHLASDAAERVDVDYEILESVTDVVAAAEPDAPAVWPDEAPDNECFFFELGDRARVEAAFGRAHHVTSVDFRVSRVSANPLEPRNAIGVYDQSNGRYTLYSGTQIPHKVRDELAQKTFFIPSHQIRVISPDVGGAFGMKGSPFPEEAMVLWASRKVGRPVRWKATRSESLLSDHHARDNVTTAELALDEEGNFLAFRVRTLANLGAYLGFYTPHPPTNNLGGLAGVYRTPAIHVEVRGIFTNTQPTAPYRGAGRPEATFAIERAIDAAAFELGRDPVELRRRNLIPASAMPYQTGLVYVYDSGSFEKNFDLAIDAADWAGFAGRKKSSEERGRLRGISIVHPIEISGGPFRNPNEESVELRFDSGGDATLLLGTHNHGQGHETTFRQLCGSYLGLAPDRVRVSCGDTDIVKHGRGTFGSRSLIAAGTSFVRVCEKIVERGKPVAAQMLESEAGDIEFDRGLFRVVGTDRSVRLEDVAKTTFVPGALPAGSDYGLSASVTAQAEDATFPNGCHVCEVEIDPQTGAVTVENYVVIDDVGNVVNPMLVKGQVHGGVAQGLGQALLEAIVYDPGSGQLLTGSFMDYGMPRALNMPPMTVISNPAPTKKNPLGVKGAGEAGTVGSLPGIVNAILNALRPLGVRSIEMPVTSERVWTAINDARSAETRPH
jgi:carbon-monoxide dehydrogenase large subunit